MKVNEASSRFFDMYDLTFKDELVQNTQEVT
jgi:hypothetical protein